MAQFASATFDGTTDFELSSVDANFSKLDSASNLAYIASNRLYGEGAAPPRYVHSATPPSADYEVSADIYIVSQAGNSAGVLARAVPGSLTGYWGRYRPDVGWQIQRYNAGAGTVLGSAVPESISAGTTRRIRLRVVGNVISLYRDAETTPIISVTDASPLTAAGQAGLLVSTPKTAGVHLDNWSADTIEGGAPTPPTGTITIGTITPSTTSASVPYTYSAGDATGYQYRLNGGTATTLGASPATISGLTASTPYSIEVRATNADGEGAWSTAANFTTSAAGDAEPPTLTGVVTFTSITQTSYTANWPAGADNVAVAGYEYQIGSTAGAWTDAGNNLSAAITGRTAGATETVYVRNYDAAGLRSTPAISGSVTLLAATASVTSDEFKNNTGTLLASATIPKVWLIPFGTPDYTNLVTNGAGELVISEAGLSGDYLIVTANADGTEVGVSKATAS